MIRLPDELVTERLRLRPWRDEDLDPLYEIYRQPEYLAHMPALDRDGTRGHIEKFRAGWRDDGHSHWAVEDRETGRLAGRIGILRHKDWPLGPPPAEVGWSLHRDFHGRGYATEGGRACVELWRRLLVDDAQLISITVPANVRSRRVMERLGLTHRGAARWRNLDVVWYALDR